MNSCIVLLSGAGANHQVVSVMCVRARNYLTFILGLSSTLIAVPSRLCSVDFKCSLNSCLRRHGGAATRKMVEKDCVLAYFHSSSSHRTKTYLHIKSWCSYGALWNGGFNSCSLFSREFVAIRDAWTYMIESRRLCENKSDRSLELKNLRRFRSSNEHNSFINHHPV